MRDQAVTGAVLIAALAARTLAGQAAAPSPPLLWSGELRARTEWDHAGGGLPADAYTLLRTRLGARVEAADGVRLFFQLQDSRVYGDGAAAVTDLHQAYVDLDARWRSVRLTSRVGRQEIALGNERLVGPSNFSNTGRTMDGARMMFTPDGGDRWAATVFAATTAERGRTFGPAATQPEADRTATGIYAWRRLDAGILEATLLYDAGARYRAYSGADRITIDARFRTAASARVGLELEAAHQAGRQNFTPAAPGSAVPQDVGAWFASARLGAFPVEGRRVAAFVAVEALSGDASAADGTYSAFSTMYATNHGLYGTIDLFPEPSAAAADLGFVDTFGSVSRRINSRVAVRADLHRFSAQAGGTGELGWEIDLTAPVTLSPAAALEVGYAGFRVSARGASVGIGETGAIRQWAYVQLRAAF